MDTIPFLSDEQAIAIANTHGTPIYVYDEETLLRSARDLLTFPNPFGLTARFAVKALPSAAILQLFDKAGLHFDCSSGYEAARVLRAGVSPSHIQITAQELPRNLQELVQKGVKFTACSLHQLREYGKLFPNTEITVRINPGTGSGHNNRTNVGGPAASFGIWHENLHAVHSVAKEYHLRITGMHTHIGSGGDPEVWKHCARLSLAIVSRLHEVTTLSLGGGFKVARVQGEKAANLREIGLALLPDLKLFAEKTGRKLHLEVEPGTFLVANAGAILSTVADVVSTGEYDFVKLDSGMTDILRPSIYGSQHPMRHIVSNDVDRAVTDKVCLVYV
jgi:diaminopimelate decarboxylase